MNINKYWFTLVELVVWISISVVLMISVSIFVSSGMKNIADEQKILQNSSDFSDFSFHLQNSFNYSSSWKTLEVFSSWVLFKRNSFFGEGWFTYIWAIEQDEFYCASWSEDTITNHAIIKTFVPFEEQWEDMFALGDIFTASSDTSDTYTSYALDHVVKNSAGDIIVWKWVYWDKFIDWSNWTDIYLNNPTGLAYDSVNSILYISDTLNNKVLYYDVASSKIYKLLDEFDWLLEPTWLYFNNNKLYIANSWRGEILEYSSPSVVPTNEITINFAPEAWFTANKFEVELLTWSINGPDISLSSSEGRYESTNFNLSFWDWDYYSTWFLNKISYYFNNYVNLKSNTWDYNMWSCISSTKYYLWTNDTPEKEVITCITASTWSIKVYNWDLTKNFNSTVDYSIKISNIIWDLSASWVYYSKLSFFDSWTKKYEGYFPYFVQWDNDLTTTWDNTLIVVASWFNYPTWIGPNNASTILVNDFIDRIEYKVNITNWNMINNNSLNSFDFWSLNYNSESDNILKTPLKSLLVDYTDSLLTVFLKYYKNYNCYNLDDNAERSYILKKNF